MSFAEDRHILRTQRRMITIAAFGDIMEDCCNINQLRLVEIPHYAATTRKLCIVWLKVMVNVFHQAMCMLIHRVGVEQVKLHHAHNVIPLRQVSLQNAVLMHNIPGEIKEMRVFKQLND